MMNTCMMNTCMMNTCMMNTCSTPGLQPTLSRMPSMLPSSTLFFRLCAVPDTDSEIFLVALVAKLKM